MPKVVDHDERRATMIEALVRVASRSGLHAVTLRSVAADAGVSLRLVQYYFESKAQLMQAALRRLSDQSNERWRARLSAADATVRECVTELLYEALPDDDASRTFHLVWTSYAVLAMTDPELGEQSFVESPNQLEERLTALLATAQADGEIGADRDPKYEAARLLAINHGVGSSVLVGQRSSVDARSVFDYHLERLFGSS